MSKSSDLIKSTFHEVAHNEPKIVGHTREKYGPERARKQEIAIALSKARKAGTHYPGARSPATVEQASEGYQRIDFGDV